MGKIVNYKNMLIFFSFSQGQILILYLTTTLDELQYQEDTVHVMSQMFLAPLFLW